MTVDITKRTVPILAETKKNEKKNSRLLEKNFNKERLREEFTTGIGTQTEIPEQKLENQVRDIQLKLKNVIKTSISKTDSFM